MHANSMFVVAPHRFQPRSERCPRALSSRARSLPLSPKALALLFAPPSLPIYPRLGVSPILPEQAPHVTRVPSASSPPAEADASTLDPLPLPLAGPCRTACAPSAARRDLFRLASHPSARRSRRMLVCKSLTHTVAARASTPFLFPVSTLAAAPRLRSPVLLARARIKLGQLLASVWGHLRLRNRHHRRS